MTTATTTIATEFERALALSRADRRLLRRLTEAINEPDTSGLLLGRGAFEDAVVALGDCDDRLAHQVERLRNAIFEENA